MSIHLIQTWGGKDWTGALWPHARAPQWANVAAKRMSDMKIPVERINEVLKEMRNSKVQVTYRIGDREYDVVVE